MQFEGWSPARSRRHRNSTQDWQWPTADTGDVAVTVVILPAFNGWRRWERQDNRDDEDGAAAAAAGDDSRNSLEESESREAGEPQDGAERSRQITSRHLYADADAAAAPMIGCSFLSTSPDLTAKLQTPASVPHRRLAYGPASAYYSHVPALPVHAPRLQHSSFPSATRREASTTNEVVDVRPDSLPVNPQATLRRDDGYLAIGTRSTLREPNSLAVFHNLEWIVSHKNGPGHISERWFSLVDPWKFKQCLPTNHITLRSRTWVTECCDIYEPPFSPVAVHRVAVVLEHGVDHICGPAHLFPKTAVVAAITRADSLAQLPASELVHRCRVTPQAQ
nr:hypothetical protein CFP56_23973 [Quercus suber]